MNVGIIYHQENRNQEILVLILPQSHSFLASQVPLFEWDLYIHFFHLKQEGPSGIFFEILTRTNSLKFYFSSDKKSPMFEDECHELLFSFK